MPEGEAVVERILLEVSAPSEGLESQSSGLNVALSQLNALETAIRRVEASYNSLMASMRAVPSSGPSGADPQFLGQMRLFDQRREAMEQAAKRQSTGSIQLDVPASQITAFVSGQVQLIIHGEQIHATVAGTIPLQPGAPAGGGSGGGGGGSSSVGGFSGQPTGSGRILLSTREQAGRTRQRFLVGDATGRHIETIETTRGAGGTEETRTTRESFERRDALQRGTFRTDQEQVRRNREAERLREERSDERRRAESGFTGQRIAPGFNVRGAVQQQREFNRYIEESRRAHDEAAKAALRFEESTRFIGRNLLKNVAHVTAWASAVAILYGTLNLATTSLSKMVETQYQSARLSQVLRTEYESNSTATRKLTDDVLRMASANGRDSKEAMESAIQWARLGLTRVQVAEAVRVSLVAANVAEITAAEATDHLSSLMAVYGLKVSELNDVLGMLNATSNTYNATNADLLTGLTKTAAVAKQAGIPLAELIGLLGAGIGGTGQSGANIGNAIKSITGSLNNADTQKLLRNQFQIETTSQGGEGIQKMPEILANIFVAYQRMNEAERQSMIYNVAGKNQASRMAAILDNYVRSQVLAINAQLNLNSAEQENVRIKETLRAQLAGWSRNGPGSSTRRAIRRWDQRPG
jgi:TP901 family phage tail tape measure protein